MKIRSIKTKPIVGEQEINKLISRCLKKVEENSIIAVTSKIVSICEGNVVSQLSASKDDLIYQEADLIIPDKNKFGAILTIKNNILIPTAGIDESNGNGDFILWPKSPQKSANRIRIFLREKFGIQNLGVIITDSKTTPLRWGTTGISIAHSGFDALNSYIGSQDIFGREMIVTKANIADGLAAAAVLAMGEGSEQTPIVLVTDIPFVRFRKNNPTKQELSETSIDLKDDLYSKIITSVKWEKGHKIKQKQPAFSG